MASRPRPEFRNESRIPVNVDEPMKRNQMEKMRIEREREESDQRGVVTSMPPTKSKGPPCRRG